MRNVKSGLLLLPNNTPTYQIGGGEGIMPKVDCIPDAHGGKDALHAAAEGTNRGKYHRWLCQIIDWVCTYLRKWSSQLQRWQTERGTLPRR